jgi:hypothetical protein
LSPFLQAQSKNLSVVVAAELEVARLDALDVDHRDLAPEPTDW